jgi:hypothetical protein
MHPRGALQNMVSTIAPRPLVKEKPQLSELNGAVNESVQEVMEAFETYPTGVCIMEERMIHCFPSEA